MNKYKKIIYPKNGTKYWLAYDTGVVSSNWDDTTLDINRFNAGNYFATEQEADLEFEWRLLNTRILRSIAILNKEYNWSSDLADDGQAKYYLRWDRRHDKVITSHDHFLQTRENNIYFSYEVHLILPSLYTLKEWKLWLTKEQTK